MMSKIMIKAELLERALVKFAAVLFTSGIKIHPE